MLVLFDLLMSLCVVVLSLGDDDVGKRSIGEGKTACSSSCVGSFVVSNVNRGNEKHLQVITPTRVVSKRHESRDNQIIS